MRYRVIVRSSARRDLIRLGDFLVDDNPRAALAAVEAIETALRSLATFPERNTGNDEGRRLIVPFGKAGYVVSYRIVATEVFIERIVHMREGR